MQQVNEQTAALILQSLIAHATVQLEAPASAALCAQAVSIAANLAAEVAKHNGGAQ
ncbi:MAG: hypothetical protein RR101_13240 [Burkholderiaceae bacterium]